MPTIRPSRRLAPSRNSVPEPPSVRTVARNFFAGARGGAYVIP
jgi:hypothetical protein